MFDFCFWQAIKDDVLSEKWISMANVGFFVKYHGLTTSTFIRFHQPSDLGWERRQWTYAAASLRLGMKHPAELGTDDPHTGPHEEWLSCINHPPLNDDIKKIIDILSICFSGFFPGFCISRYGCFINTFRYKHGSPTLFSLRFNTAPRFGRWGPSWANSSNATKAQGRIW